MLKVELRMPLNTGIDFQLTPGKDATIHMQSRLF
jgi:hypothetical protein